MKNDRAVLCVALCVCLSTGVLGCGSSSGDGGGQQQPSPFTVTSISPSSFTAGNSATAVTVTGTGFTSATVIQVGSTAEATTFVSSTQVMAAVPAAQLASGGILSVTASNGGSSSSGVVSLTINNPTPTLAQVTPVSVVADAPSATVTLTGTNFVPTTAVQVNGIPRATAFQSATQIIATLTMSDLAVGQTLAIAAVSPAPGGGTSASTPLIVNNPIPSVLAASPASVVAGASGLTTITLNGSNFVPTSIVNVGGSSHIATFVNAGQMTFQLTVADQMAAGSLPVTVVNPAPGGGTSSAIQLAVNNPAPGSIALNPTSVTVASGASTVTVSGSNFVSGSVVQVNGSTRPTTFISSSQLGFQLTAADVNTAGSLAVIVTSPAPGGGSSPVATLTVNNVVPTITALSPNAIVTGSSASAVTVTGTNFVSSTVVQVNGSARVTTYVSATQVSVALTAADFATAANLNLVAVNPAPGGGSSAAATLTVANSPNPMPSLVNLSPYQVPEGRTTPTTVTVFGTGFVSASAIQVAGAARATTYVSSGQLTFQLTVADQANVANLSVTIANPAPGGGTSGAESIIIYSGTPPPSISLIRPDPLYVGEGNLNLVLEGANFTSTSVVEWNGTSLQTTAVGGSTGFIEAAVPANFLASIGTASVNVYNSTSNPGLSNTVAVPIDLPPVPTLTSLSVNTGPIDTPTNLQILGGPFILASTVSWDGVTVPSTYVGPGEIDIALSASSVAAPGNHSLSVTTPAPGGGTSNTLLYTAFVPLPNNSMIYNSVTGLLYASVPGSAGAPYGNSIVSVDPATGALGTPILVGSEPDKLALTADGRYLWVGLDGAAAVRKVDLVAGTAGLQFSIPGFVANNYYVPVLALAALPGATDSVIVATSTNIPAIYDAGTPRGGVPPSCEITGPCINALYVDGSRNEVYAAVAGNYYTYTYGPSGLTPLASAIASYFYDGAYNWNGNQEDEIQILSGTVYSDFGSAYNAETGASLGTFYNGTYAANGPEVADVGVGKIFYLDGSGTQSCIYNQIASYNLSNYALSGTAPIPMPVVGTTVGTVCTYASRLTRWGSNGLAFRTAAAIYSVRSNSVNDLSAVNADLSVSVVASGGTTTGATTTYTATVTNAGPAASTNIVFTAQAPATGTVVSATASGASCSSTAAITCDLNGLANGASATVTVVVNQLTTGASTLTSQVTFSENDPNTANNYASATVSITGSTYSPMPVATSVSPTAILAGSSDTTITVTGSSFTNTSTVLIGGTPVATSYGSATQLSATIPAPQLTTLGWTSVSVSNPAPGGGVSAVLPVSIFTVIAAGANHIVYDPYTRNVMASIGSGANANSIVALTPETATLGSSVPIGSGPSGLALSPDGQILYVALTGSNSVARFNMLTQQPDFTVPVGAKYTNGSPITLGGIAVQPGTENTIALNLGAVGTAIYDFNTTTETAALRGQANDRGGVCPQFLDASNLLATSAYDVNSYSSTLIHWTVPAGGFVYGSTANETTSNLNGFVCVVASGGLAYGSGGVIANPNTSPATIVGTFPQYIDWSSFNYDSIENGIPDTSLQRSFFITTITEPCGPCSQPGGITAYDQNTFRLTNVADMKMVNFEGIGTNYTGVDLVRWGQDGLAALTSSGRIYLLRGPVVVPQELNANAAAVLTSSPLTSLTHGSGNTPLTLTGSGFVRGVAVTWNGNYRTTNFVSAAQVTVAIPASDLGSAGTASLVAVNPGAAPSTPITLVIN
jgi:hypothetical protein